MVELNGRGTAASPPATRQYAGLSPPSTRSCTLSSFSQGDLKHTHTLQILNAGFNMSAVTLFNLVRWKHHFILKTNKKHECKRTFKDVWCGGGRGRLSLQLNTTKIWTNYYQKNSDASLPIEEPLIFPESSGSLFCHLKDSCVHQFMDSWTSSVPTEVLHSFNISSFDIFYIFNNCSRNFKLFSKKNLAYLY